MLERDIGLHKFDNDAMHRMKHCHCGGKPPFRHTYSSECGCSLVAIRLNLCFLLVSNASTNRTSSITSTIYSLVVGPHRFEALIRRNTLRLSRKRLKSWSTERTFQDGLPQLKGSERLKLHAVSPSAQDSDEEAEDEMTIESFVDTCGLKPRVAPTLARFIKPHENRYGRPRSPPRIGKCYYWLVQLISPIEFDLTLEMLQVNKRNDTAITLT